VSLDVYLVPMGDAQYELYSEHEHADPTPEVDDGTPTSWSRRQMAKFKAMLTEAEQERRRRARGEASPGGGIWRAVMRRIAETIAEQRLLWQLRDQATARLVHPLELDGPSALRMMRAEFSTDFSKHVRWCAIDAILAAILGPLLFFVPGPNVVAYYFLFRAIGHYLAQRGAKNGLKTTVWQTESSQPLTSVRAALALPRAERLARLDEISATLGLAHLAGFVERIARPA
jgi:hypothetical protein